MREREETRRCTRAWKDSWAAGCCCCCRYSQLRRGGRTEAVIRWSSSSRSIPEEEGESEKGDEGEGERERRGRAKRRSFGRSLARKVPPTSQESPFLPVGSTPAPHHPPPPLPPPLPSRRRRRRGRGRHRRRGRPRRRRGRRRGHPPRPRPRRPRRADRRVRRRRRRSSSSDRPRRDRRRRRRRLTPRTRVERWRAFSPLSLPLRRGRSSSREAARRGWGPKREAGRRWRGSVCRATGRSVARSLVSRSVRALRSTRLHRVSALLALRVAHASQPRSFVPSFISRRRVRADRKRKREREREGESVSDRVQFSLASAHIQLDIQGDARA